MILLFILNSYFEGYLSYTEGMVKADFEKKKEKITKFS